MTIKEGSATEAGVLESELFRPWGKREVGMSEAVERSRRLEDKNEDLRLPHLERGPAA